MDETELRDLYLKDLSRVPRVRAEILKAAGRSSRTLILPFRVIKDDPFVLYACWGLARLEGVTLILPPRRRRRTSTLQAGEDMAK